MFAGGPSRSHGGMGEKLILGSKLAAQRTQRQRRWAKHNAGAISGNWFTKARFFSVKAGWNSRACMVYSRAGRPRPAHPAGQGHSNLGLEWQDNFADLYRRFKFFRRPAVAALPWRPERLPGSEKDRVPCNQS